MTTETACVTGLLVYRVQNLHLGYEEDRRNELTHSRRYFTTCTNLVTISAFLIHVNVNTATMARNQTLGIVHPSQIPKPLQWTRLELPAKLPLMGFCSAWAAKVRSCSNSSGPPLGDTGTGTPSSHKSLSTKNVLTLASTSIRRMLPASIQMQHEEMLHLDEGIHSIYVSKCTLRDSALFGKSS